MSYRKRVTFLIALDSIIVLSAIYFSYLIINPTFKIFTSGTLFVMSLTLLMSHHVFASAYRLYHKAWEYASVGELIAIAKAVTLSIAATALIQQILHGDIYFRPLAITWMLHILFIVGYHCKRAPLINSPTLFP